MSIMARIEDIPDRVMTLVSEMLDDDADPIDIIGAVEALGFHSLAAEDMVDRIVLHRENW